MAKLSKEAVQAALDAATPGPWETGIDTEVYAEGECDTWITLGPQNYDAVALVVNEHIKSDVEVGMNARLIAMAPDLATAYLRQCEALEAADRLADRLSLIMEAAERGLPNTTAERAAACVQDLAAYRAAREGKA